MTYTRNQNITLERVFARIGKGCRGDGYPDTLDINALAREFERLAGEFRVVPPDDIHAATGHAFLVDMLDRAVVLTRGLAALPDAAASIEKIGKMRARK
jgi:hypothetical protein